MDARLCVSAASQGSVDTLIALRSQQPPCDWNQQTCTAAARSGHLPVLQYLRSCNPPCPWSAEVCTAAAAAGHLAILQWARLHGCSWNVDTFEQAWENRSSSLSHCMLLPLTDTSLLHQNRNKPNHLKSLHAQRMVCGSTRQPQVSAGIFIMTAELGAQTSACPFRHGKILGICANLW